MPSLEPGIERVVEKLWSGLKERLGANLFNGWIFSADALTPNLIQGHWTEFRRLAAQLVDPDLFRQLQLRSLAVNGILLSQDGAVVGKRPINALYQAGLWQLAPAGSVDPTATRPDGSIDLLAQVATELQEELGLRISDVYHTAPVALVEHARTHVCDIGVLLRTRLTGPQIQEAHGKYGDREYHEVQLLHPSTFATSRPETLDSLAPQSRIFLDRLSTLTDWA